MCVGEVTPQRLSKPKRIEGADRTGRRTKLPPTLERQYQSWLANNKGVAGNDADYDLRGFWNERGGITAPNMAKGEPFPTLPAELIGEPEKPGSDEPDPSDSSPPSGPRDPQVSEIIVEAPGIEPC